MVKQEYNYLSSCCGSEVIYGIALEEDEGGTFGVCGSCHDYVLFYDTGQIDVETEQQYSSKRIIDHECEMVSMCCGAYPVVELDSFLTGFCGGCHDGAGFECLTDEHCENNTEALLASYKIGV